MERTVDVACVFDGDGEADRVAGSDGRLGDLEVRIRKGCVADTITKWPLDLALVEAVCQTPQKTPQNVKSGRMHS